MGKNLLSQIRLNILEAANGRIKYTRKAFQILPKLDSPRILDIGCGQGGPTLELARLSQGEIIGIDINQTSLDRFAKKIEKAGLSGCVKIVNCSMFDMDFPDESFDIIWSEGSIFIIGFERGLKEWRQLLKTGGFLVVHETVWLRPNPPHEIYDYWKHSYPEIKTVEENLEYISGCGYYLMEYFKLPENAWWTVYYRPLEKRIEKLRIKYNNYPETLEMLDKEQLEIDMYKKYYQWYGSAFFVMQKR